MSTSTKTPSSIRQGGPGSAHENAKAPLEIKKPPSQSDLRRRSTVSGGGGERDSHHSRSRRRSSAPRKHRKPA
ncbi:hypothetical protein AB4099_34735 [Bosea sp. 2KB_26]|uniref:hypothetical protein n=1 Tax=Bosea sp. 2KB_26 TaxID=3237475 RepID=UPI003F8E3620